MTNLEENAQVLSGDYIDLSDALISEEKEDLYHIQVGKFKFTVSELTGYQKRALQKVLVGLDRRAIAELQEDPKFKTASIEERKKMLEQVALKSDMDMAKYSLERMFLLLKSWNLTQRLPGHTKENPKVSVLPITRKAIKLIKPDIFEKLDSEIEKFLASKTGEEEIKNSKEA